MNLSRTQRRKLDRELKKARTVEKIKDEVKRRAKEEIIDELENTRVEILMNCMVVALHREFGFGQQRCLRVLNAIDGMMVLADEGKLTLETLRKMAEEESGIKVKYD